MAEELNTFHEDNTDTTADYEDIGSNDEQEIENDNEHDDEREETQEEKKIDPKVKKVIRNPIINLNAERLKGPKGICSIEKYFEGFKFYGKRHEKSDLNRIMKRLEHWSHRLYPKLDFDDFLEKTENLGTKKELKVFLTKYRQDTIKSEIDTAFPDDTEENQVESAPMDAFDKLIAEQIEKQKQATRSLENSMMDSSINSNMDMNIQTIQNSIENQQIKTQAATEIKDKSTSDSSELIDETKARIERNRQEAIKRRLARLHALDKENKKKKLDTENSENKDNQNSDNKEMSCNNKITENSTEIFKMDIKNISAKEG